MLNKRDRYLDKIRTEASIAETMKFEAEQKIIKETNTKIAREMKRKGYKNSEILDITGINLNEIK